MNEINTILYIYIYLFIHTLIYILLKYHMFSSFIINVHYQNIIFLLSALSCTILLLIHSFYSHIQLFIFSDLIVKHFSIYNSFTLPPIITFTFQCDHSLLLLHLLYTLLSIHLYFFYIVSFNYISAFKSLLSLTICHKKHPHTKTTSTMQLPASQPKLQICSGGSIAKHKWRFERFTSELMWTTSKVTGSCSGNSMDARTQLSTKLWHLCGKMGLNDHLRSLILMDVPTQNGGRTSEHFPGPLRLLRCRLGMPILLQPYQVVLRTIRPHSYRTHRLLVSKVSAHYFLFCFFHNDVSLENVVGEICV